MPSDLDPGAVINYIANKQWIPLVSVVLIWFGVRLSKDDTWFPDIPAKWRPTLALLLGAASAGLNKIVPGMTWKQAVATGLVAALVAIFAHDTLIEGLRKGAEPSLPKWLLKPIPTPPPPPTPSTAEIPPITTDKKG
jgi:hypothetical protein